MYMNFNDLSAIQALNTAHQEQRHQRADGLCQSGFEALQQAFENPSEQKALLQTACEHFGSAIQTSRSHLEAYLGMAYLLLVIRDFQRALDYLKEARRLCGSDPDLQAMLHYLQELRAQPEKEETPKPPLLPQLGAHSLSLEAQEDLALKLEQMIVQAVQALMTEPPLPTAPAHLPTELKVFQQRYQHWQEVLAELKTNLQRLAEHYDNLSLEQKLQPLETILHRYLRFIQVSRDVIQLEGKMRQEDHQVQDDLKVLEELENTSQNSTSEPPRYHDLGQELEHFFDDCDRYADLLDDLDTQGYQMAEVIDVYEDLVADVERLRDRLDELDRDVTLETTTQT